VAGGEIRGRAADPSELRYSGEVSLARPKRERYCVNGAGRTQVPIPLECHQRANSWVIRTLSPVLVGGRDVELNGSGSHSVAGPFTLECPVKRRPRFGLGTADGEWQAWDIARGVALPMIPAAPLAMDAGPLTALGGTGGMAGLRGSGKRIQRQPEPQGQSWRKGMDQAVAPGARACAGLNGHRVRGER
jgi:hypothetical protein